MEKFLQKNDYLRQIKYYSQLGQHKLNVAQLLMYFAYYLDLGLEHIKKGYLTGMLHDVGKSVIDIDILTKEDSLTFDEMETMKNHVTFGYENTAGYDDDVWKGVVEHHENFDGTGYPTSLKGDQISLIGRMARICDMYEALIAPRPYKGALSHQDAITIMKRDIRYLDSELFNKFEEMITLFNLDSLAEESYNERAHEIIMNSENCVNLNTFKKRRYAQRSNCK